MSLTVRQLCKETSKQKPQKVLFVFPEEQKTGIATTRAIIEKDKDFAEGQLVTVNWEGKKVQAEILALNGKFQSFHANFFPCD